MVARALLSRSRSLLARRTRIASLATQLRQARGTIAEKNQKLARVRVRLAERNEELKDARRRMAEKDRELTKLESQLARSGTEGPRPKNIVWIFGTARTGSTWLSALMGDPPEHEEWREPNVGDVFGTHYYRRLGRRESGGLSNHWKRFYALGHDEARKNSIRAFVLEGARTRFSEMTAAGYLVIKEPHGSMGAPLLMEALPESRMVFLIRDPRDVASSALNAREKGSWLYNRRHADLGGEDTLGDVPPDETVRERAETYLDDVQKSKMAYEAHEGYKVLVRYEDLRADTVGTLRRIYDALDIPMGEEALVRAVQRHSFENIPREKKGPDKFRRKATPGGWKKDLSPEQVETVERITAPLLREYYGPSLYERR